MIMKDMYFTITGCNHYFGNEFMEKGMKVKLVKEPDNKYDREAIEVRIKGIGKCGYVANSPRTVLGDCLNGGQLYDKIGKDATAKVEYVLDGAVICKVKLTGTESLCERPHTDAEQMPQP